MIALHLFPRIQTVVHSETLSKHNTKKLRKVLQPNDQ